MNQYDINNAIITTINNGINAIMFCIIFSGRLGLVKIITNIKAGNKNKVIDVKMAHTKPM